MSRKMTEAITSSPSHSSLRSLRVAIAGFGMMGQRHLQALHQLDVTVAGVADLRRDTHAIAEDCGIKAYESWESLLEMETPDALIIATNSPSHCEITVAAASIGVKYILCEKPMAVSVRQAEQMVQVCHENGTRLAVNHLRRCHPGYLRLRRLLLEDQVIGSIGSIIVTSNGGGLACLGCHFFDLMRFLSGAEPATVTGWERSLNVDNPRGTQFYDPGGYGVISFNNKTRGFIDISEDIGVPHRIELVGTWGRVLIDEPNHVWQVLARSQEDRAIPVTRPMPIRGIDFDPGPPLDIVDGTASLLLNLLSDDDILVSGEDGLASLAIYAGLRVSMLEDHREISFPLPDYISAMEFPIT